MPRVGSRSNCIYIPPCLGWCNVQRINLKAPFYFHHLLNTVSLQSQLFCSSKLFPFSSNFIDNVVKKSLTPPLQFFLAPIHLFYYIAHRRVVHIIPPCQLHCIMSSITLQHNLFKTPRLVYLHLYTTQMDNYRLVIR